MLGVFDIGGTGYRTATVNSKKQIANIKKNKTLKNYELGLKSLVKDLKESGANTNFEAICGCIAGEIDQDEGKLTFSPNLPEWIEKPLRKDLEKEFKCKIVLENDAAAEGLGEAVFGAGKGYGVVGFITAGTGIGGALINIQNSMFNIQRSEPGWKYKIGNKSLEEVAGGAALEKIYGKPAKEITDVEVWKKEAEYLAVGIQKAISQWQPEIMILNGSLMKSVDLDYLKSLVKTGIPIVRGELEQEAGLYGCLKLLNITPSSKA